MFEDAKASDRPSLSPEVVAAFAELDAATDQLMTLDLAGYSTHDLLHLRRALRARSRRMTEVLYTDPALRRAVSE